MAKEAQARLGSILRHLLENPNTKILTEAPGRYYLARGDLRLTSVASEIVETLLTRGLIEECEPDRYGAADVARNWAKREAGGDEAFRAQHSALGQASLPGDDHQVLRNLDESPLAALARRPGKDGTPFLSPDLLVAAERLRRDFEMGRLQPRITANWSASINRGRRTGEAGDISVLTEMALSARRRVEQAIDAVGPELSGVLIDVCCFLKGLETVEHERQWPARSAKLVLRIALQALARSYGLTPSASGASKGQGTIRHWGAEGYRPDIT